MHRASHADTWDTEYDLPHHNEGTVAGRREQKQAAASVWLPSFDIELSCIQLNWIVLNLIEFWC